MAAALAGLALLVGACSSGSSLATPPVPTFPGPGAAPVTSAPPPRNSILPTECDQVLASDQVPNYLGMPLGSVRVAALRDVPAPSVGRLERVTCNYTSQGGPGAPPPNTLVLKVLTSGYTTPEAAAAQSRVNRDAQASSGVPAQPVPFGAAEAIYYPDPEGPVLVVVYGRVTASFTLTPDRPVPVDQAQPVLVDLALRALPVLVPQAGS
ncbi:hypothetical protein [Actinomycetospora chlora]|uniref:hypothetical protein n=1 Tax=Actinomycetospora chlora TaxID=663608 RepID=UPI0031EA6372